MIINLKDVARSRVRAALTLLPLALIVISSGHLRAQQVASATAGVAAHFPAASDGRSKSTSLASAAARPLEPCCLLRSGVVGPEATGFLHARGGAKSSKRILVGMGVGAFAGAVVGYSMASTTCHDGGEGPPCQPGLTAALAGLAGLVVGAIVAAHTGGEQRAQAVPRASVVVVPQDGARQMLLGVTLR